jgi:LysM domain
MSAMRAEELPVLAELPAALPQDSTQTGSAPSGGTPSDGAPSDATPSDGTPSDRAPSGTGPSDTGPSDSARARAAARWTALLDPPTPGSSQTPRVRATRAETANPPLRLTRRGRVVVAVAAALVLAALSLVIASTAQATNHPVSARAAQQGLAQITVHPGQSLWSVAESADPAADTRVVIQRIIELNGLTGNVVFTGQRLWVPRG